jgi:hypothetical protein
MRHRKLGGMLLLFALGAAFSVGAQVIVNAPPPGTQVAIEPAPSTVIVAAAPASVQTEPVVVIRSVVPTPRPDPAADAKCRYMAPGSYWDCVNSHNGGGGQ